MLPLENATGGPVLTCSDAYQARQLEAAQIYAQFHHLSGSKENITVLDRRRSHDTYAIIRRRVRPGAPTGPKTRAATFPGVPNSRLLRVQGRTIKAIHTVGRQISLSRKARDTHREQHTTTPTPRQLQAKVNVHRTSKQSSETASIHVRGSKARTGLTVTFTELDTLSARLLPLSVPIKVSVCR